MARSGSQQKSQETLSSPEQLDQAMQVTRPLGWVSLLACFLLIGMAVFWGLKGEIHTMTHGQGILLSEGAIYDVVSLGTGQVMTTHVQVDDFITKGQVIARLSLPDLEHRLKEARDRLKNLAAEKKMIRALGKKTTDLKQKTLANQRRTLQKAIETGKEDLAFLEKELENYKKFFEKKLITRRQVQKAKNRFDKKLHEIMDYQSQLNDISARGMDLAAATQKERIVVDHKISQARLRIRALEETIELQSRIISPRSGKVLEIYKNSGKLIQTGEPMISIDVEQEKNAPLTAFLYFSPREGKKVSQGMKVRISPYTVKVEEYGYMLGRIRQVSGFPASQKGMLRVLQNQNLVTSLSQGGAPIAVTADLLPDPATVSKYRWSSGKGPQTSVESGSLCAAGVVVNTQTPIRLVLPFLKKNILGIGEGLLRDEPK